MASKSRKLQKPAPRPGPRTFLTDKVMQDRVQEWAVPKVRRTQQTSSRIDGDPTAIELPAGTICVARTDEAAARLCTELGIDLLPRTEEYTYQPGDTAIVGAISSDQPVRWSLHTFT